MSDRVWPIRCARGLALGAPRVTVKWRIRESGRRLEYIGPSANCAVLIPFQPSAALFDVASKIAVRIVFLVEIDRVITIHGPAFSRV